MEEPKEFAKKMLNQNAKGIEKMRKSVNKHYWEMAVRCIAQVIAEKGVSNGKTNIL
ncbi:MAG: hypothetical protein RR327_08880 [Clostridia bacterium]